VFRLFEIASRSRRHYLPNAAALGKSILCEVAIAADLVNVRDLVPGDALKVFWASASSGCASPPRKASASEAGPGICLGRHASEPDAPKFDSYEGVWLGLTTFIQASRTRTAVAQEAQCRGH
jgi:hypothetical protein